MNYTLALSFATLLISAVTCMLLLRLTRSQTEQTIRQQSQNDHLKENSDYLRNHVDQSIRSNEQSANKLIQELKDILAQNHEKLMQRLHQDQINHIKNLHDSLMKGMNETSVQLSNSLKANTELVDKRLEKLTEQTDQRLKEISGQVDKRLSEGFEKTTATFHDVIKRLALIDQAQKKITELSSSVVSLQEILADKRSRGAFGEVQLSALIRNVLPEQNFAFQYTLSNSSRVDCMLFMPQPTGNVAIDAKFPLESFRTMTSLSISDSDRTKAESQFRQDIRKHIQDIASKYIIANETADGAVMFIPAEAVFAEIHAHYPDLVDLAMKQRVWLVSPTTMMAILTTARAVLKDEATRKQVHIIQEHLSYLAQDFQRFEKRMDNLTKHIQQAKDDVDDVNTSAKKIASRFNKIEKVELHETSVAVLEELEADI